MVKIFLKSFFWLLKNCLYKLWSTAKTTLDRLTIFFTGVRECIRVLKYEESNKFGQYTLELLKIYEEGANPFFYIIIFFFLWDINFSIFFIEMKSLGNELSFGMQHVWFGRFLVG